MTQPLNINAPKKLLCAVTAAVAGLLGVLSLAPYNFWPLSLISAGLLYAVIQVGQPNAKNIFLSSLIYSSALFGFGTSWVYVSIHEFGYIAPPMALALTCMFCGGLAATNALLLTLLSLTKIQAKAFSSLSAIAFACVATISESLRSWLFSGFPWLFQGYSLVDTPVDGLAPVFGVYGLSFLVYLSGAVVANTIFRIALHGISSSKEKPTSLRRGQQRKLVLFFGCFSILLLASLLLKNIDWTSPIGKIQQVSMIQANISQHDKWKPENRHKTLDIYSRLSAPEYRTGRLVLWPEAAIPIYLQSATRFLHAESIKLKQNNAALVLGIPSVENTIPRRVHNSAVGFGQANGQYNKRHLVPFGEYIPFEQPLGQLMAFFDFPVSTMHPGSELQEPLSIFDWQSNPLICYEIVFPSLTAKAARQSDVLITLSNDSWFGASIGPLQHLQMAQMRALETGRYVLRSTGSGVSAIIDEKGRIQERSPQFEEYVLRGEFKLMESQTPWTKFGHWLIHILVVFIFILVLILSRKENY